MKIARLVKLSAQTLALIISAVLPATTALAQTGPVTNPPPSVKITSPANGQIFLAPADVSISANIGQTPGFVHTIGIFANTTQIAFFLLDPGPTNFSISFDWTNVPAGVYSLTVAATNTTGGYTISAPVNIDVVSNPPVPIVTIVATDPVASVNGDSGAFTVYRQGGNMSNSIVVFYAIGGTASNGVDYATISNTVVIPAGTNSAQIAINPIIDPLPDPTESVILHLVQPPYGAPTTYLIGKPDTAEVIITGNINIPPVANILIPRDGAVIQGPTNILIVADAFDPDGFVRSVEFFNGTNSLGVVSNNFIVVDPPTPTPGGSTVIPVCPFHLVWPDVQPGSYVLTAVATDNGGAMGTPAPVNITVTTNTVPPPTNIPPIAHIEIPTNGATFDAFENIRISAAAFDPDGFVTSVQFFNGSNLIGTVSNSPILVTDTVNGPIPPIHFYSITWSNVAPGDYDLTAVATDNGGATGTSAPVAITVTTNVAPPPTNIPPIAAIVYPTNGSVFTAPACIPILAFANDPDGFVRSVEFFNGTNSIGVVSNGPVPVLISGAGPGGVVAAGPILPGGPIIIPLDPFHILWSNVPPGDYTLTAVATDNGGAQGTSLPVMISVVPPPPITNPPVVTIFATDPIAVEGTNFPWCPPPTAAGAYCSGTNTATFLVHRTGDTSYDLTIPYSVTGTAVPGVDYVTLPGFVTIPAGQSFALITVVPLDDIDPTARRFDTVIVALTPPPPTANPLPPPYIVGWPGKAEAFILEDYDLPGPHTRMMTDGTFHIEWPGASGSNYSVQVSTDLVNWTSVGTSVVTKGTIHFGDPESVSFGSRYYRIVTAGPPAY